MGSRGPAFCSHVIEALDAAVAHGDAETITQNVRRALCDLIAAGGIQLPERFHACSSDHYSRRLLHRDAERNYSAVVMTWGAGQRTPLHDHAGLWCVDGVVSGTVRVQRFELMGERDGLFQFAVRDAVVAGTGQAGALIPPFEHHIIENYDAHATSITLHVYGGDMELCSIFERDHADWYRRQEKRLCFDD